MIRDLTNVGHVLLDEQHVQTIIRSLPHSWEHMKINLTHNDNIQTFVDISHHLELEDESLPATNPENNAFIAEHDALQVHASSFIGILEKGVLCLANNSLILLKKDIGKCAKIRGKKDICHDTCYTYGNKGHYASTCTVPRKVSPFLCAS